VRQTEEREERGERAGTVGRSFDQLAADLGGVGGEAGRHDLVDAGLCGYTRARCYSSLAFLATIGILHIKEIGEGELQKALV
jgi:hypothetical protein